MILSDHYPGINSKEFKGFLKTENVPIVFTAVNAPYSNCLNERLNQTLVNKIRCKINERKDMIAWQTIAHECTQRYNETKYTVTGFSPIYLMEGKVTNILPEELKSHKTQNDLLQDRKIALERTIKSHNYNKQQFDKNRKNNQFKAGDSVYVENGNRINRRKLDELKIGPYEIINKISNSIYKINAGYKNRIPNTSTLQNLYQCLKDID